MILAYDDYHHIMIIHCGMLCYDQKKKTMTGKNLAEFLEICLFFGFNLLFTEKNQTEFLKNFQNFLKTCVLFPLKIKDRK